MAIRPSITFDRSAECLLNQEIQIEYWQTALRRSGLKVERLSAA